MATQSRHGRTHTQDLTEVVRRPAWWISFTLSLLIALAGPAGVAAVTLNPGDIIVADQGPFGASGGGVIRVDPVTGAKTAISLGVTFVAPYGVVLDSTGQILVADPNAFGGPNGPGGIIRVDPVTGTQTTISTNAISTAAGGGSFFVEPVGIGIASNGDIFVADLNVGNSVDDGRIIRVNPATGAQTLISSGMSLNDPHQIAFDASGNILVADDDAFGFSGGIIRIHPVTGAQTTISNNAISTAAGGAASFVDPAGIALDSTGSILISDYSAFGGTGGIIRVDPVTGAQSTVSSGVNFVDPNGIALDAMGRILVADQEALGPPGAIIRVDPGTGLQTVVSSGSGPGGFFASPSGVAVVSGAQASVPEPSSLVLLGTGLAGLAGVCQRNRRK